MHAANAAHGALRSLFREVEERQLVASTHIEEDVGGGRFVAILDNPRQVHAEHVCIKAYGALQVRTDKCEMINTSGLSLLPRAVSTWQVTLFQRFPSLLVKSQICHQPVFLLSCICPGETFARLLRAGTLKGNGPYPGVGERDTTGSSLGRFGREGRQAK